MFRIQCKRSIIRPDEIKERELIEIDSPYFKDIEIKWDADSRLNSIPWINSHDHLIGNWYPRSGINAPYINSHIWVEDNKTSESVLERNKIWTNRGVFNLMEGNAPLLVKLGAYKNLFSGCSIVQDHGAIQVDAYYEMFPIEVVRKYGQCHSITLGNWWGGNSAEKEMDLTEGKYPFIIHLAEGLDEATLKEFYLLKKRGLLRSNTLIVHGISLTKEEIKECARVGVSICWCPGSNMYLIGQTLDIETCLQYGVNVVIGTDSTLTGGVNLIDEVRFAHQVNRNIPMKELFKMITVNAQKALMVQDAELLDPKKNVLIIADKKEKVYDNILFQEFEDIKLMVQKGIPLYGDISFFEYINVEEKNYEFFKVGNTEKFCIGNPKEILGTIDQILGYHKHLPYLPWQ